jgi:hypothetical protein
MNKNVLLVLVIILTPIVVLGTLAVAGAPGFAEQKEQNEHEAEEAVEENANTTPAIIAAGASIIDPVPLSFVSALSM